MSGDSHLWLFFLIVLGVVVLPGLDMAFVLASSLTGGRRSGFWAVAGIVAGAVCHVVVGTLGIGILLQVAPGAFNALLLLGALYVGWIGLSLLRSGGGAGAAEPAEPPAAAATFRRAALTNLTNPKAYLFMLAIFPQFLHPDRGPVWIQALPLGAIILLTQAAVYVPLVLAAGSARSWLAERPAATRAVHRTVGLVLIAAAVLTGVEGWRAL
jgi:threonine/homoserine/homoserine lactone efflux protein